MANNGHQYIARPLLPLLVLLLAAVIAAYYFGSSPFLAAAAVFFILAFIARDPKREVPSSPLAVLSPADGRIAAIEKETDPWLQRPALRYRIKMSLWDVHSLRSPTEGKVMNVWSTAGAGRRRYSYWIQTDEGDDVILSLLLGWAALIVTLAPRSGDRVGQGQHLGFLFFAGVVEVYMPEHSKNQTEPGMRVKSGTAILGQFVHGKGETAA